MSRRVEDLHPSFQPIVAEVLRRAPERGIYPFITEGRRAPEYQACLYAQGRLGVGQRAVYAGLQVAAALSADGKSVVVTCDRESNVVPLRRWRSVVTQVGPFGSWHVFGLAVDFSFRSTADSRDDLIANLERAIAAGGSTADAVKLRGTIEEKYQSLAAVFDAVAPDAIWGNDWDDDGVLNGPDPDNEWTDLPHWEWHPGIRTIRSLDPDHRNALLAGSLPKHPKRCSGCSTFGTVAINDLCRNCWEAARR